MRYILLATAFMAFASAIGVAAAPQPDAPACDLEGFDSANDRAILANPSARPEAGSFCRVVESRAFSVLGERHIVSISDILKRARVGDIEERQRPRLLAVHAGAPGKERLIGRAIVDMDPLDDGTMALIEENSPPDDSKGEFEPQLVQNADRAILRVTRRNPTLFAIQSGRMTALPAFGWLGDVGRHLEAGDRAGQALSIDLEAMRGLVAVHQAGADSATLPGSAFSVSRTLEVSLEWRDGLPAFASSRFVERSARPKVSQLLADIETLDAQVRTEAKALPPGVEACSFGAWSEDNDPRGLNVRAAPGVSARLLGVVPPPRRIANADTLWENGLMKSTFQVIGYRDGWFLIEDIQPPGAEEGERHPRSAPKPFAGRGWVNGRLIGAAYANGGLPDNRLYSSPHADSAFTTIVGNGLVGGRPPARVLACSAKWALIETQDGARGWFRSLCNSQTSSCN